MSVCRLVWAPYAIVARVLQNAMARAFDPGRAAAEVRQLAYFTDTFADTGETR